MNKLIMVLVISVLSFFGGCYLRGYTKVDSVSITDIRYNETVTSASKYGRGGNGFYRVVVTISNPETYSVEGVLGCFRTFDLDTPIFSEKVVVASRSDKDVSLYTLGSVVCEFSVD
jgi:hypothetical protein